MKIYYTKKFQKAFYRQNQRVQESTKKAEKMFLENGDHPSLSVHKLHGKLRGLWSFSVDRKHRIVFEYIGKSEVVFLMIGNHDIYQ